jgi:hypothetical protein
VKLTSGNPIRGQRFGWRISRRGSGGFTRLELLAMCMAAALLSALALPLFAATRADSDRVACFNNLRRLGLASLQYADDNDGAFPPCRLPRWPEQFRGYYESTNLLVCPADGPGPVSFGFTNADAAPRSYIMNGWNDYFFTHQGSIFSTNPMPLSAIREPAGTIVFGEKATESTHFWMDYASMDDFSDLEHGRHYSTRPSRGEGASNHAFADGSLQLLKYGEGFAPVNLWAVEPEWRNIFFELP